MFNKDSVTINYHLSNIPQIANDLNKIFSEINIIILNGNLGAGKTTLVKHIISAMNGDADLVTSPTFNIMHLYNTPSFTVAHFDLYRLKNDSELQNIGFFESLEEHINIIEWGDIAKKYIHLPYIELHIEFTKSELTRKLTYKRVIP